MSNFPRHIHFIGIGGAGMAPLAELIKLRYPQSVISGSDLLSNTKTAHLQELGITLSQGHQPENLPDDTELVIFSSAVTLDNPERSKAQHLGIKQLRRGEALAEFAATFKRCVAVSGSHGKSSITGALSHILLSCGMDPGFMIGASCPNLPSARLGNGDIFITEADESDATHTAFHPHLGVVPNVDADHAWSVGGDAALRQNFRTFGKNCRNLLYYSSAETAGLFGYRPDAIGIPAVSDDFTYAGFYGYEAANAFLAVAAAVLLGCPRDMAETAVATFAGVERRMTLHVDRPDLKIIEDYAHHPTELHSSLQLLRYRYPEYHLRVLFQPHRYARLEKFFNGFVRELVNCDSKYIVPVFAAWTETGKVDSKLLAESVAGTYCTQSWAEIAGILRNTPCGGKPLAIAVIGAGDVNEVLKYLKEETLTDE